MTRYVLHILGDVEIPALVQNILAEERHEALDRMLQASLNLAEHGYTHYVLWEIGEHIHPLSTIVTTLPSQPEPTKTDTRAFLSAQILGHLLGSGEFTPFGQDPSMWDAFAGAAADDQFYCDTKNEHLVYVWNHLTERFTAYLSDDERTERHVWESGAWRLV